MLLTNFMPIDFWAITRPVQKFLQCTTHVRLLKIGVKFASYQITDLVDLVLRALVPMFEIGLSILYGVEAALKLELVAGWSFWRWRHSILIRDRLVVNIPIIEFFELLFTVDSHIEAIYILLLRWFLIENHPFFIFLTNIDFEFL